MDHAWVSFKTRGREAVEFFVGGGGFFFFFLLFIVILFVCLMSFGSGLETFDRVNA